MSNTAEARHSDPATSHEAAKAMNPTHLEALCLDALRLAPEGLTSQRLAELLDLPLVTVSPRLRPMANKGLIYAGETKRPTTSGRSAIVWHANLGKGQP